MMMATEYAALPLTLALSPLKRGEGTTSVLSPLDRLEGRLRVRLSPSVRQNGEKVPDRADEGLLAIGLVIRGILEEGGQ
ncbi:hypothetical protein GGD45_004135 [Rhizobium tropici]|uniref:Uncharacterized protein n=1 Tax=Rhizobium tropici TaxID=398 RepID=A0ABR6R3E9_RHITR|nr:hypothetical protein [Rhizobium tropici]MBB6493704.1 hypothetical protein [Rhizobium tropici]TGE96131.1 hypothetical protein C9417_18755 [Rhizobium sp. SEMIA 4088]